MLTKHFSLIKHTLIPLALPIALQNVMVFSLNMLDVVMLGQIGANEVAAAGQANQPFFVFILLMFGISSGACVLTSQYYGRGDIKAVRKITAIAISIGAALSLVISVLLFLFPEKVMAFYTDSPAVIELGVKYLRYVAPSFFLSAISATYLGILVSVEEAYVPLKINGFALILNSALNFILIFGLFGAPRMEIEGAGLATLIARAVELSLVLIYMIKYDRKIMLKIKDFLRPSFVLLKDYMRYSMPVALNELLWAGGTSMFAVIIGRYDPSIIAAFNISTLLFKLSQSFLFGAAKAATVVVGKEIGLGRMDGAYLVSKEFFKLGVLLGLFSSAFLLLSSKVVPMFLNIPEEAILALQIMILIDVFSAAINAFNTMNIVGVLRAGGDTRFSLFLDTFFIWCYAVPFCALLAYLGMPFYFIMLVMRSEEIIKLCVGLKRFVSKKWINQTTRESY